MSSLYDKFRELKKEDTKVQTRTKESSNLHINKSVSGSIATTKSRSNLLVGPITTDVKRYYDRGDLPFRLDYSSITPRLAWRVEIHRLDFHHYLPILFDGLRELSHPYTFIVENGIRDMLQGAPQKLLPVIPQLIAPIKNALNTKNKEIIARVLRTIQIMILSDTIKAGGSGLVGQALVPYYRQILPTCNRLIHSQDNVTDGMKSNKTIKIGDLVVEALELMEKYGGEDAYINIKYLVPTYQSVKIY